ncbi:MAG: hypothetical protein U0Z75_04485 [Deinococcaceae bacterium]
MIGLHFALNATQEILGLPGSNSVGLLQVDVQGPNLLSGGRGGLGASLITVMVGIWMTLVMLAFAQRRLR